MTRWAAPVIVGVLATSVMCTSFPAYGLANGGEGGFKAKLGNTSFKADANSLYRRPPSSPGGVGTGGPAGINSYPAPVLVERRTSLGCGDTSSPDANLNPTGCSFALQACASAGNPDGILYYVWQRPARSDGPWLYAGSTCSRAALPPDAPPPPAVPSLAQIQRAFRELPFAKPGVHVQPEGNVTLVNLPTFYEARWPEVGLSPGEVSEPVQLLSWRVEFEVAARSYDFDFGDGSRSGASVDAGGTYPNGGIRHTYARPRSAPVRVDAMVTGRWRANGGGWQDIDAVADLQDEPVTTVQVREARARLYAN